MPIIDVYKGFKILHTQKSPSGSCIQGRIHPSEGPIWPSQLLQRVAKLSVSPVSEAFLYEPGCPGQINPVTGVKICLVTNHKTQFSF